jgi:mRNA interferase MazF
VVNQGPSVGAPYIPERGDVVWLTLHPQAGHEQAGRRPALVLSPKQYNGRVGLAIFCPLTSQVKGYPFEVEVRHQEPRVHGVILSDQVKSLDWRARQAEFICIRPQELVTEVLDKLRLLIDTEP